MRVLTFAHRLEVGGTQVNAVELAAQLRDRHGHQVSIFATPGPMQQLAAEKRLTLHPAPDATAHPSLARARALQRVIAAEHVEVLHIWDWPQFVDGYFGACIVAGVPTVVTSMAMVVNRELPRHLHTTFGTPELAQQARRAGRRASTLLPPVDTELNSPAFAGGAEFRRALGFDENDIVIATVSRLVAWMKAESLRDTIAAVRELGRQYPLRFVIVGDGTSRNELERLAAEANADLGRQAIILTGALIDPRPAYAAADVVVGMGGSALRGLAFGKALIVVGERGFSQVFSPATADDFLFQGLYGLGDEPAAGPGNGAGAARLTGHLRELLSRRDELGALGRFGREFVVRHYALDVVGAELNRLIVEARQETASKRRLIIDGLRIAGVVAKRGLQASVRRPSWAGGR
jgi:glycosyltransferase involved in cell wall biosynthesis